MNFITRSITIPFFNNPIESMYKFMHQTKRSQNKCKDCKYTWYPRGKELSSKCPQCGSKNVVYATSIKSLFIIATAIFVFILIIFNDNSEKTNYEITNETKKSSLELSNAVKQALEKENSESDKLQNQIEPIKTKDNDKNYADEKPKNTEFFDNKKIISGDEKDKIFSDEEIDRLEAEKQYSGDDPIVRARLGLPSRITKKLEE